ncbi:hypothetical protein [Arthrobacter sp. 9MFCol3.1]|nr:hypothetical protein [Arthrobacter sp. 9MFCol3.1]
MLATDRPTALARQPEILSGSAAGTDPWATSCPDDCHYCSGPETD